MNYMKITEALTRQISEIAGVNDPQTKIDPPGFLEFLIDNSPNIRPEAIVMNGKCQEMRIQYMPRGCEESRECHSCDGDIPEWKDSGLEPMKCREIAIKLNDDLMCQLETAANRPVSMGTPPTSAPSLIWEMVRNKLNGLLRDIDNDLLEMQAAKWGKNVVAGTVGPQTVTFGNTMSLNNGITQLKREARLNVFDGRIGVVGNGYALDFFEMNRARTGQDMYGYNGAAFNTGFNPYYDLYSANSWGENHFGVFAEGTIGFLEWFHNGGYNGKLMGDTYRFILPIPIGNGYTVNFDAYLRTIGCPDYATILVLGKTYGLWNMPDDVFDECDRLHGVNGSLHYVAEYSDCFNVCTSSPAPAPTPEPEP